MASELLGVGVDLGGTKTAVVLADEEGRVHQKLLLPTDKEGGPSAVRDQIVKAVKELRKTARLSPVGVGIGVAGQIEPRTGLVHFAPNLDWHDVPFGSELNEALELPVTITNDVRAATLGEWLYGAGRGCDDLICIFVGTGIGGGIVSGGRLLAGCTNTAGEVGHITIDVHGPPCTCGNRGCMEAVAGGWAIARRAREAALERTDQAAGLLEMAGGRREDITAKIVARAYLAGDELAKQLLNEAVEALIAGSTSLVNAFNPCRLVLGGGVVEGLPEWVPRIAEGVRQRALSAATLRLEIVVSRLGSDAGAIGAAALAMQAFGRGGSG